MYLHSSAMFSRIIPIIRFRLAVACAWTAFAILIASWEYWDYLKFKSVAISTAVLEHAMHHSNISHLSIIVVIWLLGMGFLWTGFRRIQIATAALMAERDNLSAVFDATPMPMLLFDDRMEAVRVNGAFRAYCSDYDTLPDKRCGTILKCANALSTPHGCGHSAACDSGLLMQALREVLKSGLSAHGEVTIPRIGQDGGTTGLLLLYGVEPVSLDGKNHALLSFLDISERKLMEKQLAASEREFRALAETMPDNIVSYDRDNRIIYINPALERALGMPLEAVRGKLPIETPPAGQYDAYQAMLKKVLATGIDAEMELPKPDGAGGILYYQIRMVAKRDQEGAIRGALAIGRDITELKQLEKEQANRERELRTLVENYLTILFAMTSFAAACMSIRALEQLTGKPALYLIGKTPSEAFLGTAEGDARFRMRLSRFWIRENRWRSGLSGKMRLAVHVIFCPAMFLNVTPMER
jgi:PAS domain S-box-containing protein